MSRAVMVAQAIEKHPAPWRTEPAPFRGFYVLDDEGSLVTYCETEKDAAKLVDCSMVFA